MCMCICIYIHTTSNGKHHVQHGKKIEKNLKYYNNYSETKTKQPDHYIMLYIQTYFRIKL